MNQNWYHKVRHLYFEMFFKKNLNLLFDIDRFNYWTQKECLSLHLFPKSISKNKLCIANCHLMILSDAGTGGQGGQYLANQLTLGSPPWCSV